MPERRDHFENPAGEYAAARTAAAWIDLTEWTQVEIGGSDHAKFLHNFCTNDIRGLPQGAGCEAFITSVQGKVLAHVFVLAGERALALLGVPGCAQRIINHLSRYHISEDVTFTDLTAPRGLLLVVGPHAASALASAGGNVQSLTHGKYRQFSSDSSSATVFRNDFLGLPCYLIACAVEDMHGLHDRLNAAGARPAGTAAFDALRIEAGFPLYGVDISDDNLAQEVNRTAQAISFAKGCYLGQEPIARIDALGHVNQQLRGLRLARGPVPAAGAEVLTADNEPRKIGHITSAAISYATNQPVALGYLKRNYDSPGLAVSVATPAGAIPAEVFWPDPRAVV
jgi:folate-binding protein YgfZ